MASFMIIIRNITIHACYFCNLHIDGQYLASRLSKSIVKESESLKQLIKEYNKLVSPDEHLLWADVTDLSSSLYQQSFDPSAEESMVPRSVKIEAIKYHYLSLRAQEDIDLLKEEMNNVIQHYVQDKTLLLQCVEETSDIGHICLLKNELKRIDKELQCLSKAYRPYIVIPDLPVDDIVESEESDREDTYMHSPCGSAYGNESDDEWNYESNDDIESKFNEDLLIYYITCR